METDYHRITPSVFRTLSITRPQGSTPQSVALVTESDSLIWDKESWENFNNEIKYCEKHIILPDIPEDQVKQKATEIIKAHGITKGNVTEEHREIIEKELIHWIVNQIDTVNEELKQNYNQYDGYQCVCGNCTCNL